MKLVSVKDDNGKEYVFETDKEVVLIKIVESRGDTRILGYGYSTSGYIMPKVWSLGGQDQWKHKNSEVTSLTPYDKFKDLKKAFSEGAKIEFYNVNEWNTAGCPTWSMPDYRIKGNISIESWNTHQDTIKAYWSGSRIEERYSRCDSGYWYETTGTELWSKDVEFRALKEETVMSISEIEEKFGIKNLKIKGE